jgi:2-polyprenyl-3-methyl-5-hydroxy-6-metoxy-1,4-benzoquinol methylase
MLMDENAYLGTELELFAAATRWKAYVARQIAPYLDVPEVLEVGAGLGGTTRVFCSGRQSRWICLEPDTQLASQVRQAIDGGTLPSCCRAVVGTLASEGPALGQFDTILYMDVLEHIEDDREELNRAARHLRPGGHVVALGPAHPFLYTPFDRAIGHYRRYTKAMIRDLKPDGLTLLRNRYLDSVGLLASLGNRLVLQSATPQPAQIAFWDRVLVRASTVVDPLVGYTLGKSVLAVWRAD